MVLRSLFGGGGDCTHLDQVQEVTARGNDCEECQKDGHPGAGSLRLCLTCGHVGCCDSSPYRHARRHAEKTGHPIMRPLYGGNWKWCYPDNRYL